MRELVYVLDTYCGWCYGFGPTVRELVADPEVSLTVRHGALFTGDRSAPSAERLGLDAEAVRVALKDPDVAARAAAEHQQVLGLGVDHYPTLLAVTERGLVEVGSPTASAAEIKAAL
ncbi:hypothetical protein E4U03_02235 [Rothia nasimurium]|uniref:Thioredoxin n=1 Tax=Rothia nasimurium TaxID=85336 RepID=A0A4Y9F7B9_9MICC|nr:DsbA family protein [Rothia nasimurium]MBF0807432.1 hypothetical protein [Rothia nasimurium]TFU23731.1 hypothetical protein E4U03_02235 [Rothia nasimurium]